MSTHTWPAAVGAAPGRSAAASDDNPFALVCADGRHLVAHWTEPSDGPARAVALISPAAGVPQRFYRPFAQWLAGRGYAVLRYDYRGIGASALGIGQGARGDPATMREWALQDMPAALAAAEARRGAAALPLPLLLVGHSFGGNAIAFARGVERADALLTVASQAGDWRLWPASRRWLTAAFYAAWVPLLARAFGQLPGWALGAGEPMPRGVALDWARWGRQRGYFFDDPELRPHRAFRAIVAPVHVWSFDDDRAFAPRRAVDVLAARFEHAALQRHHLHPAEAGLRRIGHFSMFRREPGTVLWPRLLAPLEAAAPGLRQAALGAAG